MMNNRSLGQRLRKGKNRYRGVTWHKRAGKYAASIKIDGRNKHLGYFATDCEGLEAVNRANAELFPDKPELQQKIYVEELKGVNILICKKW